MPKLYLISGGSRGLGAALMSAAVSAGDSAVSISRQPPQVGEHLRCDLTDPVAAEKIFESELRRRRNASFEEYVLINNAGMITPIGSSVSAVDIVQNLNVNLTSHTVLSTVFVELAKEIAARKLVVNITSGAATAPIQGWRLYCAAKAGLEHFGRTLALEQKNAPFPVDVVNISPGIIDTDMQSQIRTASQADFPEVEQFKGFYESGDLAKPDVVANKIMAGLRMGRVFSGATVSLSGL